MLDNDDLVTFAVMKFCLGLSCLELYLDGDRSTKCWMRKYFPAPRLMVCLMDEDEHVQG